jgi:hypothetical protein
MHLPQRLAAHEARHRIDTQTELAHREAAFARQSAVAEPVANFAASRIPARRCGCGSSSGDNFSKAHGFKKLLAREAMASRVDELVFGLGAARKFDMRAARILTQH